MAKQKQETMQENENITPKRKSGVVRWIIILLLAGGAVYGGWQNREQLKKWSNELLAISNKSVETEVSLEALQAQLASMQGKLQDVEYIAKNPDFSAINQRIEDIEHINANTVKSKADVEALMGLLVRMDAAEERLRNLAQVSDEGALLLTAAALVKDAGERGGEFVYEAEVLSQVVKDNAKASKEAEKIEKIAADGVPNIAELQRDFIAAYIEKFPAEKKVVVEEAQTWYDRIFNQLKKIVQIKNTKDKENIITTEPTEEEQAWEIVKDYVISGEIIRAIGIAEKPLNHKLLEDNIFQQWYNRAKVYQEFYDSISKITANGLAVMKVKFLKKN